MLSATAPAEDELAERLSHYGLDVRPEQLPALCEYAGLLWSMNRQLNLTRHTNTESFVTRDLLDTLKLSSHIPERYRVLDVGSGGGVPGIPLAVLRPDLHITLAESVVKKADALKTIVKTLNLSVPVQAKRAEAILKHQRFHVLTVRAVASLRKLLFWFQLHRRQFDRILLIKGPKWIAERDEAQAEGLLDRFRLSVLEEYPTPGHDHPSVVLSAEPVPR